RPLDPAERALPAQLLDLVRTGRKWSARDGRLYRSAQDHVGDRLPAPRRVFSRRARHGARAAQGPFSRDAAWSAGRRRDVFLRIKLTPFTQPLPCPRAGRECLRHALPEFGVVAEEDERTGLFKRRQAIERGEHRLAVVQIAGLAPLAQGSA